MEVSQTQISRKTKVEEPGSSAVIPPWDEEEDASEVQQLISLDVEREPRSAHVHVLVGHHCNAGQPRLPLPLTARPFSKATHQAGLPLLSHYGPDETRSLARATHGHPTTIPADTVASQTPQWSHHDSCLQQQNVGRSSTQFLDEGGEELHEGMEAEVMQSFIVQVGYKQISKNNGVLCLCPAGLDLEL